MRGRGAGREAGGPGAAAAVAAQAACLGNARLKAVEGQGTRGAHFEHAVHVRDIGGVKAERLIERRHGLPSRNKGRAKWGEVRAGRREGVRRRRRKRHARGSPNSRLGGQCTRGAHVEHVVHVRDLGGVPAQRLVEGVRSLPSRKGVACDAERGAGREAGESVRRSRRKRHTRGRPDSRLLLGARARAERTANMWSMFVTLEVSQLSGWLNARATCRVEGRGMRCGARCGPGGGRA